MALMPDARPQSAALLQRALMGQRITTDAGKKVIRPSGNYRPDLLPDVGSPMTIAKKKKTRGFLEKLFFFMVLMPALAVFGLKLMVQFDVVSEPELFDRIDTFRKDASRRVIKTVEALDTGVYDKWGIRIKPKKQQATPVASTTPAEPVQAAPVLSPFRLGKNVVHTLSGHHAEIVSFALLRSGDALASLDAEGRVRLWDTITGLPLRGLGEASQIVGAIAAAPDGKQLAWSVGTTVSLHDIDSKKEAGTIEGHDGNVRYITYSPNGALLAAATDNRSISVWRLPERTLVHRVEALPDDILAITFSANGRLLATADARGEIHIVSATNGAEIARFLGLKENDEIVALAYSPDGHWLASSGPTAFLKLWDTGIDVNDRQFAQVPGALHALRFSPDSKWLMATSDRKSVQIWDVGTGKLAREIDGGGSELTAFALSANGEVMVTGGADNKVRIWR
jgi:hypothetical protein